LLVGLLWLLVKVTQRREVRHRSLFPIHPVAPTRIVMVVMSKCTGTLTFVRLPSTIWCLTDFSATGYKFSDSGIVNLYKLLGRHREHSWIFSGSVRLWSNNPDNLTVENSGRKSRSCDTQNARRYRSFREQSNSSVQLKMKWKSLHANTSRSCKKVVTIVELIRNLRRVRNKSSAYSVFPNRGKRYYLQRRKSLWRIQSRYILQSTVG
jgi:hypothetical protein